MDFCGMEWNGMGWDTKGPIYRRFQPYASKIMSCKYKTNWPSKVKEDGFLNFFVFMHLNPLNFNPKWVVMLKQIVFWISNELFLHLHKILHVAFIEILLKIELEVSWKIGIRLSFLRIREVDPRYRGSRITSRICFPCLLWEGFAS